MIRASFFLFVGTLFVTAVSLPVPMKLSDGSLGGHGEEFCKLCQDTFKLIQGIIDSNGTLQDIITRLMPVCVHYVKTKSHKDGEIMCPGILKSYGPVVLYVITHKSIHPYQICAAFHFCPPDRNTTTLAQSLKKEPALEQKHSDKKKNNYMVANGKNTKEHDASRLKLLQFNDVHLDRFYKEGTAPDCGLYVCCRSWQPGNGTAGYYGNYSCDLPVVTLDLLLENIKKIDPDIIIYAGDNSPHDLWNETVEGQLSATKYLVDRIASFLPGKPIYPALGNHETFPESEYLGTLPRYQYMTEEIAQYWKKWVNFSQEALETAISGGYYTMEIREGLRLISLNSDYWYTKNLYSFLNEDNPRYYKQVQWLEETFSMAEKNGDKVLFIAHIPSGDSDNLPSYGQLILNITKRYQGIIVGMLTGHTHKDQFQLIQDKEGLYGVSLISPSVTPYGHINPSFRIYQMDETTYELLDYQQYYLDLAKANDMRRKGLKVDFELEYVATQEYLMPDISPSSWSSLVKQFEQSSNLLQQYYFNMHSRSERYGSCDSNCQKSTLCQVKNCNTYDYFLCNL